MSVGAGTDHHTMPAAAACHVLCHVPCEVTSPGKDGPPKGAPPVSPPTVCVGFGPVWAGVCKPRLCPAAPQAPFTFVWIGRFARSPRQHEQWLLSLNRTVTNYDQEL